MSNRELVQRVVEEGYRMPNPVRSGHAPYCSDTLHTLMLHCWLTEPERRPGFARVKEVLQFELEERGYKGSAGEAPPPAGAIGRNASRQASLEESATTEHY